jgi:dihydroorotase
VSTGRFGRLTDAPASLLLAGVRVIDPNDGSDGVRDLAIVDGFLAPPASLPADAERIDAAGLVAAPGFCDLHTHLREPGDEGAESIESGARAAARGGYTTVCAMPNTDPPLDRPAMIGWVQERARQAACRVRVIGSVSTGRAGESLAELTSMADAGAVGFSDDGAAIPSRVARAAMTLLRGLGLPLIEHCEDATLAGAGVMRAGPTASRLGVAGWAPSAELTIVERDIALAAETGTRLHLTHLSTAAALEAVRRARARGLPVTCDVTPHHMALTDAWVAGSRRFVWEEAPLGGEALDPDRAYDGRCRVNPPLASRDDALALLAGLADHAVDAIATDHAPHPPERKLVPFDDAAPGLIGLETALSLGLAAVEAGHLQMATLISALSIRPAEVIGERRSLALGQAADLVVFEPGARWRVEASTLASGSANTPLLGMELPGIVRLTVAEGRVTYRS